jgi:hypothetical protein
MKTIDFRSLFKERIYQLFSFYSSFSDSSESNSKSLSSPLEDVDSESSDVEEEIYSFFSANEEGFLKYFKISGRKKFTYCN